jgi:CHAD domain-containing protein
MSYRLEADESFPEGVKRIVREQLDRAVEQLMEAEDRDEAVHEARKHFKKIRAVLRLVRDEIGEDVYKPENVCYRDAGRKLAPVRDSFVKVETLEAVTARFAETLASGAFEAPREALVRRHAETKRRILEEEHAADEVVATLSEARERIADWPIEHDGISAFRGGLRRVYKRGRNRLADARDAPGVEVFHEWRKRVKYLWYHTRILRPIWSDPLGELADEIHDLADYLGDYHDLAVLRETVVEDSDVGGDGKMAQHLIGLIDRRRAELQAAAWPVGGRIYVETPDAFVARFGAYWEIWLTEDTRQEGCLEPR